MLKVTISGLAPAGERNFWETSAPGGTVLVPCSVQRLTLEHRSQLHDLFIWLVVISWSINVRWFNIERRCPMQFNFYARQTKTTSSRSEPNNDSGWRMIFHKILTCFPPAVQTEAIKTAFCLICITVWSITSQGKRHLFQLLVTFSGKPKLTFWTILTFSDFARHRNNDGAFVIQTFCPNGGCK